MTSGARWSKDSRSGQPEVDALATWSKQREEIRWARERLSAPGPVIEDGHRRFIETVDPERDPERAARLLAALDEVRRDAHEGETLTFERLCRWQSVVLGTEVQFRASPAMAHGGAERYGLDGDTKRRFEACLADAHDEQLPAVVRAARAYLDVCYFHPFADGNARAARLVLDFILTRAGLGLHAAGPIFVVARRAADGLGPYSFQSIVDYLSGPIGWR